MPRERRVCFPILENTCLTGMLDHCVAVDEYMDAHSSTSWRRLDQTVIIHTRSGSATWSLDGRQVAMRAGTLVALAAGTHHRQEVGDSWWHAGYLILSGPWMSELREALVAHGGAIMIMDQAGSGRKTLDRMLDAAFTGRETWAWTFTAGFGDLIARLLHHASADAPDTSLADRLRRLVDDEPNAPWRVPMLARALGMSDSALAHRCTAELGLSPAAWVRQRKVHLARQLLKAGLSVTAASDRLGFSNPYHFSRVVRAELGQPPSRLRGKPGASPLG